MPKKLFVFLLSTMLMSNTLIAVNADTIQLPNIGTTASSTLSIDQEIEMGDFYVRLLRGNAPLNEDPLINDYVNQLGYKLVTYAESVKTPFNFFVMQNRVINAFAFFGGNVVIHSGLILETDTESELAAVMSHEIGHVTQRHLARALEKQKKNTPYVWGSTLGSLLLGLANPDAGIAALTTTLASSQQDTISFTQSNEIEADRVGLSILTKAGFNSYAFANFLQKLADKARYSSKPPAMLLTHPLPESRLLDIRNRSNQLQAVSPPLSSPNYLLAKIRLALFSNNESLLALLRENYEKINNKQADEALIYGEALQQYQHKNYDKAARLLTPLLNQQPNNIWFIDLMTNIDLAKHNFSAAIQRLKATLKRKSNSQILQLNLAKAYLESDQLEEANNLLHRYTYQYSNDINGWNLFGTLYAKQHSRGEEMSVHAEISALRGKFTQAITLLSKAELYLQDKPNAIARNDARISQLEQLKKRYSSYRH